MMTRNSVLVGQTAHISSLLSESAIAWAGASGTTETLLSPK
jgi:hypothetical protein